MYKKGVYKQINSNYGIVVDEENVEYFIFKRDRANAFSGDIVKIKIIKDALDRKKAEGEIIEILSRTKNDLVGVFLKTKGKPFGFVKIYNTWGGKDIFINEKDFNKAQNNDVVLVYVTGGLEKPFGAVKKVLGNKDMPKIDELIILYENNVRLDFTNDVLKETERLESFKDHGKRTDLTHELIVTIDGADAKDLDDAIGVRLLPNGNYELGVHIADVTHYVTENRELDKEALKRGTSIYLPEKVIPMLPEKLSNNLCSLNPHEQKATLSIIMEIDAANGKVLNRKILESFIKSKARLTYDEVSKIVEKRIIPESGLSQELMEMLNVAYDLKKIVYSRRKKEGKIEFEFGEVKIKIGKDGKIEDIYKLERNEAHRIIEEFMIIANEEISSFFSEKKIPFLYRVHERPGEDSIFILKNTLESHGIYFDLKNINPLMISHIIDSLKGKSEEYFLSKQVLQAMAKAKYSDMALGHFGLSLKYYSHFTSPIRRYPDLQIHRIIKEYLNGRLSKEKIGKYRKGLGKIAKMCSENEQRAEKIEDKIKFLKIVEYMEDKVGEKYDGIISGISPIGIYVELENGVEGFIHSKNFETNMIFDEENKCYIGEDSNEKYFMGKKVMIEVMKADKKMGFLDFAII
ncbi:MAG: ribonuclease R [Candidatus Gracilibacteria bacterium]|nr:ribonuclease R [Candidatus Gracilibacteria bacterium]